MNSIVNVAIQPAQDSAIRAALDIAAELAEARAALAEIITEEARHEANLAYIKAKFQLAIVEAAGGEKAFGANEDERKRKLVCELEMRAGFTHAREQLIETQAQRRLAEAGLRAAPAPDPDPAGRHQRRRAPRAGGLAERARRKSRHSPSSNNGLANRPEEVCPITAGRPRASRDTLAKG